MTDPYNSSKTTLPSNVVQLHPKSLSRRIEHVDSSTIVEIALTDEERAEFTKAYDEALEREKGK
jgi:hypothetical protein